MQVWNVLHAARWKFAQKNHHKWPFGHHRTNLMGYIFATKAHIDNWKNLLSSNIPSTYPHNMVNFGPLAAEICWRVWGTPANFNGFRLGSVTAPHSSSGCEPNFAALNRERHLYSAGRPSRWALAHISSLFFDCQSVQRLLRYGWILSDRFCYSERSIIDGGIPKLGVCTSFLTFIPDT